MSALGNHVTTSNDLISVWRQRRSAVGSVWRDAQWVRFERICNEEIHTLLLQNAKNAAQLDDTLTSALNQLDASALSRTTVPYEHR